jgi:DNA topoisomerase I
MSRSLVIVESPAKAKTIGKFLGKKYKIAASMGHLRDLPKSTLGVDIDHDFEPKYINIRGKADLIKNLKKEAKEADTVYLATDPDREGEAISWHLANMLDLSPENKNRISFNEITEKAVTSSIQNARKINMDLVDAQQARRVLDRIVGYKISPILWKKVKKGLSAGRVQSVTLRLVCDREKQIEGFVPKEYWIIEALLDADNNEFKATFYGNRKEKTEIGSRDESQALIDKLRTAVYTVTEISKKEKKKTPAPPFITSTLQQEASRRFNFPIKKTMMLAQQLYEGIETKGHGTLGLITYMRTDSLRISDEAADSAKEYILKKYGKAYCPDRKRVFKNNNTAQDAHESVRPTHIEIPPEDIKDSMPRDIYKLYKLIWDRFIASQMEAAVYDSTAVKINADGYVFKAVGNIVKFKGYTVLYSESKDDDTEGDEKEYRLPELTEGQRLTLKKLDGEQKFTQPPSRYTEASLVKELEDNGIGRPSTYAPTISTIMTRGYVAKEKKVLIPTELGMIVNDIMVKNFNDIVDVEFTAKVEKEFDEIENGKCRWQDVLSGFYGKFEKVVSEAEETIGKVEVPQVVTDEICEKCGRNMVLKIGRYGKFLACPGFPGCRNIRSYFEKAGVKCPVCDNGEVILRRTKQGRVYYGCTNYPECRLLSWDKPTGEKCAKCGTSYSVEKYVKNNRVIRCSDPECNKTK